MGTGKEIAEIDEFAVILVFDVDIAPSILSAAYLSPIDVYGLFGADDGKWNNTLEACGLVSVGVRFSLCGSSP